MLLLHSRAALALFMCTSCTAIVGLHVILLNLLLLVQVCVVLRLTVSWVTFRARLPLTTILVNSTTSMFLELLLTRLAVVPRTHRVTTLWTRLTSSMHLLTWWVMSLSWIALQGWLAMACTTNSAPTVSLLLIGLLLTPASR